MKAIVAVNSNCYHGYSLDRAIEGIKRSGFSAIELTATRGWTEHVMPEMPFKELAKIKKQLQEENLLPIAMSGHCNLMDPERLTDFLENMELASYFGCRFIVSSIGEAHLEDKVVDERDLTNHLICLLPDLERLDLMLVLEVHGKQHGSGKEIRRIVKAVNSPLVKINYDTANAIFYGDVDVVQDMEAVIDDIAYIHLKDKAGPKDVWNFPALGEGYVDFDNIFKMLKEKQNNAPLSIEIEFTEQGPRDANEVDAALVTSANYLKSLGIKI